MNGHQDHDDTRVDERAQTTLNRCLGFRYFVFIFILHVLLLFLVVPPHNDFHNVGWQ